MISQFSLPSQIFAFFYQLLNIYYFLLIARIFLGWIINSYTLEQHPLGYWLCALTDPFLRLFRRLPFSVIGGVIDISPIFALFAVTLAQRFVRALSATQSASVAAVFLGMLFQLVISVIAILKTAVLVCTLILLFRLCHLLFGKQSSYNLVISHIDVAIRKLLRGPLRSLKMAKSSFSAQVILVFALFCLFSFLLALSESFLGGFFLKLLNRI